MKKLSLAVITFFLQLFSAHAQTDTSCYKARKLSIEEINFVSAYYSQDGNNSAVTGGIGTEKLTDFANTLELRLTKTDKKARAHSFGIELGIDHYTSASSDNIDPATISSASRADTRIYPTLSWSMKNDPKAFTIGANTSFSTEFDYKSYGIGVNVAKTSKDNNTEVALKLQSYFDTWTIIYPVELRTNPNDKTNGTAPRNSYSASFMLSHVVNRRLEVALLADGVYQVGQLATEYQRVYFTDGSVRWENLPDNRLKLPIGARAHLFLDDRFIVRAYYRFYTDDWGITAHTANIELPVKLSPFFSISPFYRYYTQTQVYYFKPYGQHSPEDTYYTSDYDLSAFNSQFYGGGIRYVPEKGVLGVKHWASLEVRYGHYTRSNGLHSDIVSLYAKFK